MLGLRLREGLPVRRPVRRGRGTRPAARSDTGCWIGARTATGRAVLTLRGRLLADALVRDLLD